MNLSPPRLLGFLLCGVVMVGLMAGGVAWIRSMSKPTPFIPDTASGGPRKNVKPVKPEPPPEVTVELPDGIQAGDAFRIATTIRDDNNTPVKGGTLRFVWFPPLGPEVSRDVTISHHGLFYLNFRVPRDGSLEVRVLDGKGAASAAFRVADGSDPNRMIGVIQMSHHFDVAPR